MTGFDEKLRQGRLAESLIARWLQRRGYHILPAYEKEGGEQKGPRIFSAKRNLIAPDWLTFGCPKGEVQVFWCEAKNKAAFTWHRLSGTYQDGIDKRYWLDYLELRRQMLWPLWILFLHVPGGVAKDNPPGKVPPSGLFGGEALRLAGCIHHESDKWGKGGMVYWRSDDLVVDGRPLATYEQVCGCAEG